MIDTPGATDLNEFLLTVIRQQRHFGARVIVSTQEPTISTQLIDLCAITVIHRFTSPDWFRALKTHISISSSSTEGEKDERYLFRKIVNLRTGEALIYAPTAVLGKDLTGKLTKATEELLKVSIRKRVTWDGGQSIVCV
jgi:DNA helicase HerA-like ATPase